MTTSDAARESGPATATISPVLVRSQRTRSAVMQRTLGRSLLYLVIIAGAIVFAWPLAWLVSSSLKPDHEIFIFPPNLIPSDFIWNAYPEALAGFNFIERLRNTMTIVLGVLIGRLISCSMAAYAFARLRAPGRTPFFVVVLGTMMLPYYVQLIPQFIMFKELGWLNSFLPLIVPDWFAGSAFSIFLLRQFFMSIDREYDDAARIDGCGFLGIFFRIIVPMSLPALGVIAILTFMSEYNDFLRPLLYLNDLEKFTLVIGIRVWEGSELGLNRARETYIMAVSVAMTAIPMVVFFFTQRYFIQGVVIGGLKG